MLNKLFSLLTYSMISKLCLFFLQALLTYILVIEDYGRFAEWMTDINLLGVLIVFGLDNSFIYHSRNKNTILMNLLRSTLFYSVVSFSLLTALYIFITDFNYYAWLVCYIFISSIYQVVRSYFLLQEEFNLFGFFDVIRPFLLLMVYLFIHFSGVSISFNDVMLIHFSLLVCCLLLMLLYFYKSFSEDVDSKQIYNEFFNLQYVLYGARSVTNTFLAILLYSATVYYISYYGSKQQLAIFFVAATISKLMWILPDTIGSLVYPIFIKIKNKEDKSKAFKDVGFYLKICFLINCLAFLSFVLIGSYLIDIIYDKEYESAYIYIVILLIGNQGMVIYKILSRYLASQNQWSGLRVALICGFLSNIIINLFFFDRYGLLAASIATSASFWVCGLIVSLYVPGSLYGFFKIPSIKAIFK